MGFKCVATIPVYCDKKKGSIDAAGPDKVDMTNKCCQSIITATAISLCKVCARKVTSGISLESVSRISFNKATDRFCSSAKTAIIVLANVGSERRSLNKQTYLMPCRANFSDLSVCNQITFSTRRDL